MKALADNEQKEALLWKDRIVDTPIYIYIKDDLYNKVHGY